MRACRSGGIARRGVVRDEAELLRLSGDHGRAGRRRRLQSHTPVTARAERQSVLGKRLTQEHVHRGAQVHAHRFIEGGGALLHVIIDIGYQLGRGILPADYNSLPKVYIIGSNKATYCHVSRLVAPHRARAHGDGSIPLPHAPVVVDSRRYRTWQGGTAWVVRW